MSSEKEYVFVSEFFAPDTAGTGRRMTELATGLRERGLDLTVYTAQPHQAHVRKREGDRWLPRETGHEGVPVRRPPFPLLLQTSLVRRVVNWTLFSLWLVFALLSRRRDGELEVIAVSHPPFVGVLVWLVCGVRGWEYTFIVHDLYPDVAVELGHLERDGLVHRVWQGLNEHVFGAARYVVTLGPAMRDRVLDCAPDDFDPDRALVIHNWESSEIEPRAKEDNPFSREHGLVDTFAIQYSGTIAVYHDLETLVRAAPRLPDVEFLLIGDGEHKAEIVELAEDLGVRGDNVRFLPYLDRSVLPYSLTAADVSVVSVKEGFEGLNLAGKLYTSLAAGQPVLVIAQPHDDEARIVDEFDAGAHVPQGDVDGVVSAVRDWVADPELVATQGENAREAFERSFTKERGIDEYYRLFVD